VKPKRPFRRQETPEEVRDELLRFIQVKFYPGDGVNFFKDRPRLLKWVVLKLAEYLDERAVTVPPNRYIEIMRDHVLMEAVRFGRTDEIKYRPAWLGKVVEMHLDHHGEEYYEEGKAIRSRVENALTIARAGLQGRDPVRELAQASRLLTTRKQPVKKVASDQLSLL
jgi:hypothetical protein